MTIVRQRFAQAGSWLGFLAALAASAGCAEAPGQLFDSGGAAGASGAPTTGGGGASNAGASNGGATASGGSLANGGTTASGGALASGGSGGTLSTGGKTSAGGGIGLGGTLGLGGALVSGGKTGSGGSILPSELVQQITKASDDCTWIRESGEYQERLRYSDTEQWLEVGNDGQQGRIGLRFALQIPPKATIVSASLQLQRVGGNASSTDSLTIQVYDSGNVPTFDATHRHQPEAHVTAGLFATTIRGTLVGEIGKPVTTADLKLLVQRVVDRADFAVNGAVGSIGFVIFPESVKDWASYGDSSAGMGATLKVSFRPLP